MTVPNPTAHGIAAHVGRGTAPACAAGEPLLADAIAHGADGWRECAPFGLQQSYCPLGYPAAQAEFWRHQAREWMKSAIEA